MQRHGDVALRRRQRSPPSRPLHRRRPRTLRQFEQLHSPRQRGQRQSPAALAASTPSWYRFPRHLEEAGREGRREGRGDSRGRGSHTSTAIAAHSSPLRVAKAGVGVGAPGRLGPQRGRLPRRLQHASAGEAGSSAAAAPLRHALWAEVEGAGGALGLGLHSLLAALVARGACLAVVHAPALQGTSAGE